MIDHYNAFISYKHAPEDNKVAEAVQRGLEHFKIPSKIQKKTGMKRINRIFRDKDELPITSDLSDTIANALANSDYLIVICSTNTKQSAWVPREIEFFLRNHTRKQIFTVLVNGEPYDVIPEILTYEDRLVWNQYGQQQSVRIPIEPLSCDYRMPLGKANKIELPRLASGLIGCSYDELMNRRRQYRIRRMMLGFSAAFALTLAFSGYMFYSRNKIRKNYLESLRNQSKYLANESSDLLEKEQRIPALQLALEALPKSADDDRPITAEAVKALTDATLAYEGNKGANIHAAWNYKMPNAVSDFKVSGNGSTIAILDAGNVFGVWNTKTHEKVLYLDNIDDEIIGMKYLTDKSVAIWSMEQIMCYDTMSGDKLWEYSLEEDFFKDREDMMLGKDSFFIATGDMRFLEIDSASGKLKNTISIPESEEHPDLGILQCRLSPDGKKIAFRGLEGWSDYVYGTIDAASGATNYSEPSEQMIKNIEWLNDSEFVVATALVDLNGSMSVGDQDILSIDHSTIQCVNAGDLSEKWKADFVCNGVNISSGFVTLNNDEELAFYSGNVVTVYNAKTGEMLYSNNVNDPVLDVSDRDGDGKPLYITSGGGYSYPLSNAGEGSVYYTKYFADDLRQVVINEGVYVRQHFAPEVIFYGTHEYDDSWKAFDDSVTLSDISSEYYMDDQCLALISNEEDGPVLTTFGLGDAYQIKSNKLEGEDYYYYTVLGSYKGSLYLGYQEDDYFDLVTVNLSSGEVKKDPLFDMYASFRTSCVMSGSKLYYYTKNEDMEPILVVNDIDTGKKQEFKLPEDAGFVKQAPKYFEALNAVYFAADYEYIIDAENGNASLVDTPADWASITCFSQNSDDKSFAVTDGKRILLTGKDGSIVNTINCPGIDPLAINFIEGSDDLLVLYNDGSLYWYSASTGDFKKKTDVTTYYAFSGKSSFSYDKENKLLYVQMEQLTDVIDMENGVEIAHITNCFGHHKERDIFITSSYVTNKEVSIGYYKRYAVDELIDKAHDILQDAELSDEQKSQYGIETESD